MTEPERVTIRTGSRTYATGVLMWRDVEKGTAVVQIGDKIITGEEIKKEKDYEGTKRIRTSPK